MLLCIGKPMIDIIVKVDENFLKKYDLHPNDARQATEKQAELFREIVKLNPIYVPGGSITNTVRIFQRIFGSDQKVFYLGIIGNDYYSRQIKKQLRMEKINFHFCEQNAETVQCAVLISQEGKNRSLITDTLLKSAQNTGFDKSIMDTLKEQISKCTYFYVPTFTLGLFSKETKEIIKQFRKNNKKIIINLSAGYILEKYSEDAKYLFQFADIVIGNEEEYRIFAKISNIVQNDSVDSLENLLVRLQYSYNVNGDDNRALIVTRGCEDVVTYKNGNFNYYSVEAVNDIVDTTGAGDAFAGGFLAQFVKGETIEKCVKCGVFCGRDILQYYGCHFNSDIV